MVIPFIRKSLRYFPSFKTIRRVAIILIAIFFFPQVFIFWLLCGVIDLARNYPLDKEMIIMYFIGDGDVTWYLSPLNLAIDLLALNCEPVYKLEELPKECQDEINSIVNYPHKQLIAQLADTIGDKKSEKILLKWNGINQKTDLSIDEFQHDFKYVKTIGISALNSHQSSRRHFGRLRPTLRVIYVMSSVNDKKVYIQVTKTKHYWQENPLFIFDHTYIHQSFNGSDQIQYYLYVDVIRPTKYFYKVLNQLVKLLSHTRW